MSVKEAVYICDKCGLEDRFIKSPFDTCVNDWYQKRLCKECLEKFLHIYDNWVAFSKAKPVVVLKKKFLGLF